MIRLLVKEFISCRWILGLTCLGAVALVLIGDPLFFRGDSESVRAGWLALPFFILGLRAYSGELAGDTVQFLYSRPIKWWKIWISKLLAGILGAVSVLVLAGVVYALAAPDQYRPFVAEGIMRGLPIGAGMLAASYAVGFAVSMLMPGLALSFASLLAVLTMLSLPLGTAYQISERTGIAFLQGFAGDTAGQNTFLLAIPAVFAAGIIVARRLPKLGMKERWIAWIRLPLLALIFGSLLAVFQVQLWPAAPYTAAYGLSPNGCWAVHRIKPSSESSTEELALVDTRTGRTRRISSRGRPLVHAWSADSRKFAWISHHLEVKVLHVDGRSRVERVAQLDFPRKSRTWYEPGLSIAWHRDSRKLAVLDIPQTPPASRYRIAVVDTESGSVRIIERPVQAKLEEALSLPPKYPVLVGREELFWPPGWDQSPASNPKN